MQTTDRWSWLDLRLVPPALTVWVLTLLAPHLPTRLLLALAAASALGAAGLLLAGRSHRAGALRQVAARGVVIGCLAAVTVTGATAAVRAQARAAAPLLAFADRGSVVEVLLELTDDPRPVAGAGAARVLVHGTASLAGDETGGDDPVLLFGAAEEWAGLLPGQSVRLHVLVRPAEPRDDVVAVLSARSPPAPVGGPGAVQDVAGSLRTGLAESAARTLPDRAAGLLPGLVVGDTRAMDPALVEEFRRAGLAHLTAVSGANVAIVVGLVLWPLRARAVDRRWQALAAALAIAGFVVLARPGASVLRAAAMGAVAVLALASGRARAAVPALAVTVLVLLLLSPGLASDVGFALSVSATAAIVLLAPGWSRALRRHRAPRPVADAVAVSAAAGLATAPLVAGLAGLVSLVSLPANLLAAPAVPPATVLGVLAALVSPAAPWLADVLTWLAGWPVRWLVVVAERAAAVPDGTTGWPAGTRGAVLLAALLAVAVWALWRWPRLRSLALAALVGVVLIGWPLRQVGRGWPLPDTVVVACDVGQGDALVLPTGPDEAVLVDAGPDPALVDGCLRRLGVDRLPLVLLSHLDADHVGGLAGALAGRHVGEVATGALTPDDERVPRLDRAVAEAAARHVVLRPGDRRTVGSAGFEVLAPDPAEAVAGAEPNDLSLVVRATQRGVRVLLTGDLGAGAEARLVAAGLDLGADVFKVPHHGSADADPGFLAASGAAVALISVGADNSYGHPTRRLLDWVADAGMRTYRTDRHGDVAVVGRAGEWGVAVRGPDAVLRADADAPPPEAGPAGARPAGVVVNRRRRPGPVGAPWQHGCVATAAPPAPTSRLRVVVGEEELLRARAVSAVRAAVRENHPDSEEHELPAAGLAVGQLADVLAPSLFGGHRLVVVTGAQESAAALAESLVSYTKEPDPELTLVVVHSGGKRNEALLKAFKAAGAAVDECPKISSAGERVAFVRNEVRFAGGKITPDAVTALLEAVGNDLRGLSAAASQLVSDFGGVIDADAVARFHRGQAEVTGFTVAERVLVGDMAGSVEMLRWALDRGVAHVLIADALADGVRTAARVASLNTTNIGELARQLKLPPWKVKKAQAQARGWSIDALQQAIGVAADLNADVKGAAASADYALERAIRRMVDIRAAAAGGRARALR
ncbi:ComEC/Rec2 family competence protein [Modestobacter sp. VKM Ac-2983]|uniref:DNA polymerase III subunit delta n=1 Tax=Modestobacter sp. VKM Ac-2983 TaxID=3004137 RepID=UPI0022AB9F7B|nr:ComEC/Rec2 family competence protein [Modestobacter sp. VKM Ac-2983]MCZ2804690.1 ComEC/Rec2 family competence protein [Modestobacter sp. VKM Ac-2983]